MSYNPQNPNGQATSANSAPVVIASDQSAVAVSVSGGSTSANQTNASQKTQIVDGSGNVIASTGNALKINLASGSVPAGTNTIGNTIGVPTTSGGLSMGGSAALSSTAVAVKSSAGQVYGWYIYNPNTSIAFVQFYNTTTGSTTVGTNVLNPLGIPAGGAANVFTDIGLAFSTAITVAACTTVTGNTAPATALVVNIYYN